MRLIPVLAAAIVAATFAIPDSARAAGSYDSCTYFIDKLPALLTSQGTWCLRKDLGSSLAGGEAVSVLANNVTIDCNGFKIGGLGAGPSTQAAGIASLGRLNTVVRGCNVRGFHTGIRIDGGGGHVIEDNRVEGNQESGIVAESTTAVIRRNQVLDSGAAATYIASGILVSGTVDVIDNTIDGVAPESDDYRHAAGIRSITLDSSVISGNRVRGLAPTGDGVSFGVINQDVGAIHVHGNHLFGNGNPGDTGIYCTDARQLVTNNRMTGFDVGYSTCTGYDNLETK